MKNKKGQYYFFAIVLIAIIIIGLITISNFVRTQKITSLTNHQNQIENERSSLLDYLSSKTFSDSDINETFRNFSNSYISQFGEDFTSIFLFGKDTEVNILANITENTNVSIEGIFLPNGKIDQTFIISGEINLTIDEKEYPLKFQKGQNLYYLVQLKKNNEVYIING